MTCLANLMQTATGRSTAQNFITAFETCSVMFCPPAKFQKLSRPLTPTMTIELTLVNFDKHFKKKSESRGRSPCHFEFALFAIQSACIPTWGSWLDNNMNAKIVGKELFSHWNLTKKKITSHSEKKCWVRTVRKKSECPPVLGWAPKVKSHREDGVPWPQWTSPTLAKNT